MRKGYAIFSCKVYGVECKGEDICQTTGKSKTGGGIIREIPKCYLGKLTNTFK